MEIEKTVYTREEIAAYDDLPIQLDPSQYPRGAVGVIENPNKKSRVKWLFVDDEGNPRCSAKSPNWTPENPTYCFKRPYVDPKWGPSNGRCKYDGGKILRGFEHQNATEGRYFRSLPQNLAKRFVSSLLDPDLHKLDSEIALVDSQIENLLESLGDYGGEEIFKDISDAFKSLRIAQKTKDQGKIITAMEKLDGLVSEGSKEYVSYQVIHKLIDQRRRLVLAEAKRLQLTEQFVPVAQVNLLLFKMLEAVKEFITDPNDLSRLSEKLYSLMDAGQIDVGTYQRSLQLVSGSVNEDQSIDAIDGDFEEIEED